MIGIIYENLKKHNLKKGVIIMKKFIGTVTVLGLAICSGSVACLAETPVLTSAANEYSVVVGENKIDFGKDTPFVSGKNVMLPMEIKGVPKGEQKSRAEEMLELVGLKDFKNNYPCELSGGMQQRVSIARALTTSPNILLMDEPFSALDEFTREKLHDDLLDICAKRNMTVIFVTHNISESDYLSDRVVVMSPHPGRVSAVIKIELPHPREAGMRNIPEYFDYISKIRSSFEGV